MGSSWTARDSCSVSETSSYPSWSEIEHHQVPRFCIVDNTLQNVGVWGRFLRRVQRSFERKDGPVESSNVPRDAVRLRDHSLESQGYCKRDLEQWGYGVGRGMDKDEEDTNRDRRPNEVILISSSGGNFRTSGRTESMMTATAVGLGEAECVNEPLSVC